MVEPSETMRITCRAWRGLSGLCSVTQSLYSPTGEESWCKFQRATAALEDPPAHTPKIRTHIWFGNTHKYSLVVQLCHTNVPVDWASSHSHIMTMLSAAWYLGKLSSLHSVCNNNFNNDLQSDNAPPSFFWSHTFSLEGGDTRNVHTTNLIT